MNKKIKSVENELLEKLKKDFAEHRSKSPSRPFPLTLWRAALDALEQGVALSALKAACGISTRQLRYWRRVLAREDGNNSRAKVLNVVDDLNSSEITAKAQDAIEIRIGPWRVALKLDHINSSAQ